MGYFLRWLWWAKRIRTTSSFPAKLSRWAASTAFKCCPEIKWWSRMFFGYFSKYSEQQKNRDTEHFYFQDLVLSTPSQPWPGISDLVGISGTIWAPSPGPRFDGCTGDATGRGVGPPVTHLYSPIGSPILMKSLRVVGAHLGILWGRWQVAQTWCGKLFLP